MPSNGQLGFCEAIQRKAIELNSLLCKAPVYKVHVDIKIETFARFGQEYDENTVKVKTTIDGDFSNQKK